VSKGEGRRSMLRREGRTMTSLLSMEPAVIVPVSLC
jgi:hypothetical protein